MKAYSSRFQPGEGPNRGLLHDFTTSPINRLHSTSVDIESVGGADTHTGDPCYCSFTSQTSYVYPVDICLVKVGKMTSVFTAAMNEVISRYLYI